jgi:hypothetical protein
MVATLNEISPATEAAEAPPTQQEKERPQWLSAYTLRSPESEIIQFVEAHPNLDFGLAFAPKLIAIYFQDAPLVLSLHYDPEISSLDTLVIDIQADLSIEEGINRLDEFGEKLWIDFDRFLKFKISLDVQNPNYGVTR